jgi:hypothetical protein
VEQPVSEKTTTTPTANRKKSTISIPNLTTLRTAGKATHEDDHSVAHQAIAENQPFTEAQLREAWKSFSEQRSKYKAEYQLLNQTIELHDSSVVLQLLNPVQETLLNSLKQELMQHIREYLKNFSIQVTGELREDDAKKVIYTNREKFEHLAEKNPSLLELKERLGLDPDY